MHKSSFLQTHQRSQYVYKAILHTVSTASFSGCYYFLTFINDISNYVWLYVLKSKDEVFQRFKEFKSSVEKETGYEIKCLRSDNGGEYKSANFEAFLRDNGIKHECTVPKTPEQNGKAERMNRTLVEAVRTMLADAHLPKIFWAEPISKAVYLRNRSPTTAVTGKTPFEALTGKKPNVQNLKIFGCLAYSHVAKDERQKLDFKSNKCIFLGYECNVKGYRLYDVNKKKVFVSRDVIFNEMQNISSQKESNVDVFFDENGSNIFKREDVNVSNLDEM